MCNLRMQIMNVRMLSYKYTYAWWREAELFEIKKDHAGACWFMSD